MRRWPSSTAPAACSGSVTAASPCSSGGPDGGDEALPQAAPAPRRGVAGLLGSARPPRALLPALPRLRHQALLPACALPRLPLVGDRVGAGERARHGLQLHRDVQNQAPGFREELPYVLAIIELDEGVRMMTNVVGCAPDAVRVGMAVEVVFEDVMPEITLAKFRPA